MRLTTKVVAILVVVIIFGGYALADFLGINDYNFRHGSGSGRGNLQSESKNEESSIINKFAVEDIRGSFTLKDVGESFDIEISVLVESFAARDINIENTRLSDINERFGEYDGKEVGTSSVKLFVAYYKGLEYEIDEEIYLPERAIEILIEKGNISKTQEEYLQEHIFNAINNQ